MKCLFFLLISIGLLQAQTQGNGNNSMTTEQFKINSTMSINTTTIGDSTSGANAIQICSLFFLNILFFSLFFKI
jgi:hypothetical protein